MNVTEIIREYTDGEATLEETNSELKKVGSNLSIVPGKNSLTEEEIMESVVGNYPKQANGFGLLDTGTGSLDKVQVKNGKLVNLDNVDEGARIYIVDKMYYVDGNTLTDKKPGGKKAEVLPMTPNMKRRQDLASQVVETKTGTGLFMVTYDDKGYAVKATRKEFYNG